MRAANQASAAGSTGTPAVNSDGNANFPTSDTASSGPSTIN